MQAEDSHFAASGTADTAVRARKCIQSSSRAILSDGEDASALQPATPQPQESLIPDGLQMPAQTFLRAHQPLRFLLDQALMVLSPCAALLGFQVADPLAQQGKQPNALPEVTNARTE